MYTEFGKWLKMFRITLGIRLYDMGKTLGLSSSFLSSIETGKKNIPFDFVDKLKASYNFSDSQLDSLEQAVQKTREEELKKKKSVTLKVDTSANDVQELVYSFARCANSLTEKQKIEISNILRGEDNNG